MGGKAPALPRGAVRGCSYLKWRVEGRFFLSPGWSPTPPNSMLNRLSSSRGSPWCFLFFERIRFQDFFYFFVEKTLLLMKNQHFIIIITFHQITHQLVLSIFTWDFIFSSKFSLWKHSRNLEASFSKNNFACGGLKPPAPLAIPHKIRILAQNLPSVAEIRLASDQDFHIFDSAHLGSA